MLMPIPVLIVITIIILIILPHEVCFAAACPLPSCLESLGLRPLVSTLPPATFHRLVLAVLIPLERPVGESTRSLLSTLGAAVCTTTLLRRETFVRFRFFPQPLLVCRRILLASAQASSTLFLPFPSLFRTLHTLRWCSRHSSISPPLPGQVLQDPIFAIVVWCITMINCPRGSKARAW